VLSTAKHCITAETKRNLIINDKIAEKKLKSQCDGDMSDALERVQYEESAGGPQWSEEDTGTGGDVAEHFSGLRNLSTGVDCSQLILVQHRSKTPLYNTCLM